jgi:hypothetical protein
MKVGYWNYVRMTGLFLFLALLCCASLTVAACKKSGGNAMAEKIIAQVVLKAANGSSILDADPESVVISEPLIEDASEKIRSLGCDVLVTGVHSLSISCEKQRFEKIFNTSLKQIKTSSTAATDSFFQSSRPVTIPDSLVPYVADVLLPVPPGLDL